MTEVRGQFTILPKVLFPQPSPTERWFTPRNVLGHTQAVVSQPPLSRVSSVPKKGCPVSPYHFSSAAGFARLAASQRLPDPSRCAAATTHHAREGKGQNRPFY